MTIALAEPTPGRRLKRIMGVRVEPELYDWVEAAAAREGRTVSGWVRRLLLEQMGEQRI